MRAGTGHDTVGGLLGLPAVLEVPQAGRLLGVGRTFAYELVRTGQWPTPVIHVGRLIKIPTKPLLEFLSSSRVL